MTTAQKVIKYLAIAFAIFLSVNIFAAIFLGIYGLLGILGLGESEEISVEEIMAIDENKVEVLEIDVLYTNLKILSGDEFKIEADNNYISCKQEGNKVYIEEEKRSWFSKNEEGDMIIYIPKDLEMYKIEINTGAGKIEIEDLNTEQLSLELGAGETIINNISVTEECNIDGGAGKISVNNGTIKDLDLDMGIGETNLIVELMGKNEINAGIGNLNIELQGNKEDYKIQADKGIGSIKIKGNEQINASVYGNGNNSIEIDGGIGNIDIDFEENI